MTTQHNGLRFDIYERVHLSEGAIGIQDLEGVELVPHIQVIPQGDQALLRGNLFLTGTFVDELGRSDQTLEHLIPVEITLPMNRVQRMEDIAVEIENFDVDLLSSRSLNITGVLSLAGLELVSDGDTEAWRETENEVVFVHEARDAHKVTPAEASDEAFGDISSFFDSSDQASAETESWELRSEKVEPTSKWPTGQQAQSVSQPAPNVFQAAQQNVPQPAPNVFQAAQQNVPQPVPNVNPAPLSVQETGKGPETLKPQEAQKTQEAPTAQAFGDLNPTVAPDKDLKVGVGSKKTPEPPTAPAPLYKSFGLSNLFSPGSSKKEKRDPEETFGEEAESVAEKVEWKNLLLTSKDEEQGFKRLRLCIVQKEETLESIAKRYDLNPREIALYNRLGDNEVSEGQIVYIPK
ncbi:LysM peptidoglycan-binding domain-containing protein [Paenibacillus ehimensis]|uniref:LysM peptidoglycan-binding domain-containing protein n=1 Tax=Paenibacillus ehimensis TaxID=79264 RepID=A0ABT8V3W6_9BACL|nr:LysM peptidoglycan-binding domain-containing protein [Paenibacillus ehimensis]MDO3676126.1 LysM peptidoglycan-binding domain-containing protein [Paenibacillus ehimensis]